MSLLQLQKKRLFKLRSFNATDKHETYLQAQRSISR